MSVVQIKKIENDKRNILMSLEYLVNEAKEGGCQELHSILNQALNSAKDGQKSYNVGPNGISFEDDPHRIIELLVRFRQAPRKIQLEILEALEYLESNDLRLFNH